ncbi:hypothetical protein PRIPAC_73077 [Pristionchus pacificus]|uniref:G protein-coupled receptor n=1 Tax=Pristionchus pacificus TaxID=54126 RepID=A0A2A6C6M3_PRIPA|nr:hypothetical protein PRIPAC_73077 [Pristionchus pacificus]|eukprot:PDM73862.1 G protein-coupled receptor [Pristionchus pacificus]
MDTDLYFWLSVLWAFLIIICFFDNLLIVWAIVQNRNLRGPCFVLIGISSYADSIQVFGLAPKIFTYFLFGLKPMDARTCLYIELIPLTFNGVSNFTVISIALDRLFASVSPSMYARKNIPAYYAVHFVLIAGYTALQLSHLLRYFDDGEVHCTMSPIFMGYARVLWFLQAMLTYAASVVIYFTVAIIIRYRTITLKETRLFHSLMYIFLSMLCGYFLTCFLGVLSGGELREEREQLTMDMLIGTPMLISLCLNYFIYYLTSAELRRTFQYQLRLFRVMNNIPLITPVHSFTTSSTANSDKNYQNNAHSQRHQKK